MSCIEKRSHSCGSSDGLQVFLNEDGTHSGYCFSCNTYVHDPYAEGGEPPKNPYIKTEEEMKAEVEEAKGLPIMAQEHRGLSLRTAKYYGVRTALSQEDGVTPTAWFFPYEKDGEIVGFKVKTKDKRMWSIGNTRDAEPFGLRQALTTGYKRHLFITEGEEDAEAGYEILTSTAKKGYEEIEPSVISIPSGASGAAAKLTPYLTLLKDTFETVVLAFDMDEQGKRARQEVMKVAPWIKFSELPEKDLNACLLEGRIRAARTALVFENKVAPKNTKLINGASLIELACKPPEMGRPWPFPSLTAITRGRRPGEVYYFGAGVKMGKSELVDELGNAFMIEDGNPVLFVKPEQAPVDSYKRLVGKAASSIFHDPNKPFSKEAFDKGAKLVGEKAIILDSYQFVNWDTLQTDILHAVKSEGVQDVIIDPITCFTNDMSDSDANVELRRIASELALMTKDLQFSAYVFCHLLAPKTGASHERGGRVESTQFAGSRAMMRSCQFMIGMEGNKDPDLTEEEKNIRSLVVLENREFGTTGRFNIFWDENTGRFREIG